MARIGEHGDSDFLVRMFLRGAGRSADEVRRRPVIGIANSWSELSPCNLGLRDLARAVKAGVSAAGGLALEFPTISLGEAFVEPTSLYLRNLMSIDVEEMIRASPIDGVVLLNGCDKTVPAQIMGALSANIPTISLAAGPRPSGEVMGERVSIDDLWSYQDRRRQGELSDEAWASVEGCLIGGIGTCDVMGTASTMASVAEVLGLSLPGSALLPAHSTRRLAAAHATGKRAVELAAEQTRPSEIVTLTALQNAFRFVCATAGSTNVVIHLEAFAGRIGVELGYDGLAQIASSTPTITAVRPAGSCALQELDEAGAVPRVMAELAPLADLDTHTAAGSTWRDVVAHTARPVADVVTTVDRPFFPSGGLAFVRGSLAPDGAVVKRSTASARLCRHVGRAVVFNGVADLRARVDDETLNVDERSVMVLRNAGPVGGPGMSEAGHLPIPRRLLDRGVTDIVRVSDARMSGTASGTVVLHVAPEAAVGGPLALVRDGDMIRLDVDAGVLDLLVEDSTLASRRRAMEPAASRHRGYARLYRDHVLQATHGCDFDFLRHTASV